MRGRRRQRGATLLPYPFGPPPPPFLLSLFLSFRTCFTTTCFEIQFFQPLSLLSLQGEGNTIHAGEKTWTYVFLVYVYPRFFLRKKLVHFVDCQPERNLNIFSFIILLQREKRGRGECDECWKHRAFSLYRGICNLMEFAGNINKPSKRFPN